MRSTLIFVFVALLLPIGLAGCLPTGGADKPVGPTTTEIAHKATPGLTPKERNLKAVELLNEGKAEEARVELQASLAELPADRNPLAQNLISQIGVDPETVLGTDHFTHTVEKGESLSAIAGTYLKDVYKFYILALYNDMDNPSQLQVGQKIGVPGKGPRDDVVTPKPAPPVEPPVAITPPPAEPPVVIAPPPAEPTVTTTPPPAEPPVTTTPPPAEPPGKDDPEERAMEEKMKRFAEAREKSDAGNYPGAIEIIEAVLTQSPDDQMFRVYGSDVYNKYSDNLLDGQKYQEALTAGQRGAALNPDNADLSQRIEDAKKGVRADGLYQDGRKYEASQSYIEALESYKAALKVWPAHEPAQIALAKVGPKVADEYYRAARTAFQQHDLEKALEYYDKTLEIDSSHEPAKLERQRTIQLIDKLKQAG